MDNSVSRNKQIAKNTIYLYFRMILTLLVSLYTSRIVIYQLGFEDYGITSVVGGVVGFLAFLNASMSSSTQRYLTYELGTGNKQRLQKVFSASLNIHIGIVVLMVIIAETIGLWFVNTHLVIPEGRLYAANWVYQFSLFTFCTGVLQVPYNAAIIAHEKMSIYAYISIVEVILKLAIVYCLSIGKTDKLILYTFLLFLLQQLIRLFYRLYCKYHFEECKFQLFWEKGLYKEMVQFAGWNMFGSIAWILRDNGVNIIINLFFGTVVNAARGIATYVSNNVNSFATNFIISISPQITKLYATNNLKEMERLTHQGLRFSFFLLYFFAIPLMLNVDFVLPFWLVNVPHWTSEFIILFFVDTLLNQLFGSPLITGLMATGKIRNYQIVVSSFILAIIPIGYFVFLKGGSPLSIMYVMIASTLVAGIARYGFCVKKLDFSIANYLKDVLFPVLTTVVCSFPISYYLTKSVFDGDTWLIFIVRLAVCVLIVFLTEFFIGMRKHERSMVIKMVSKKLFRS